MFSGHAIRPRGSLTLRVKDSENTRRPIRLDKNDAFRTASAPSATPINLSKPTSAPVASSATSWQTAHAPVQASSGAQASSAQPGGSGGQGVPPGPRSNKGSNRGWVALSGAAAAIALVGVAVLALGDNGSGAASAGRSTVTVTASDSGAPDGSAQGAGSGTPGLATESTQPASSETSSETPSESTEETTSETSSSESSDESPTDSTEPTDDGSAVGALDTERSTSLSTVQLDGTWAAQLASPYVGAVDTLIQPTPFTAMDIYNQHQRLKSDPRFSTYGVILLRQNDFGKRSSDGREIWVTLALLNASSADQVRAWCRTTFASEGANYTNFCLPRQMVPLHS